MILDEAAASSRIKNNTAEQQHLFKLAMYIICIKNIERGVRPLSSKSEQGVTFISSEIPDDRCSGLNPVSHGHIQCGFDRKIDIQPRPKADHPESSPSVNSLSCLNMANDPPGDESGNLNETIAPALVRHHENSISFVIFGGLVEAGVQKLAGVVRNSFDLAVIWNAVDMNIKNRHEDADLLAGAIMKRGLIHFPGNDDSSISRRNDGSLGNRNHPVRISEKISDKKSNCKSQKRQCPQL